MRSVEEYFFKHKAYKRIPNIHNSIFEYPGLSLKYARNAHIGFIQIFRNVSAIVCGLPMYYLPLPH